MKDRPQMQLLGMDGNIFYILGRAVRTLKQSGLWAEAEEMYERAIASHDYHEALGIISEYVQTELSEDNPGILEAEDIRIAPGFCIAQDGLTAYIEPRFDAERRFGILLGQEDTIDMYATYHPEKDELTAVLHIQGENPLTNRTIKLTLLPSERKRIRERMEECAALDHTSLKDLYSEWRADHREVPIHSKNKEKINQYER